MFNRGQMSPILMLILFVIFIFAMGVVTFTTIMVSNELNTEIQSDDDSSVLAKSTYSDLNSSFPGIIDNGIFFLFIGVWIALIIGSYFMSDHPVIFIILLFVMVIMMFIGGNIANAYSEMANDADFIDAAEQLTKVTFLMTHFVEFVLAVLVSIGVAMMIGRTRV